MRVAVIEAQSLFLDSLVLALATLGVDVVGRARCADEALRIVDLATPDVAVLGVRQSPDRPDEGLRTAEQIRRRHPRVALLVLSSHVEVRHVERLLDTQEDIHGVGYLLSERVRDVPHLIDVMRRVAAGEVLMDPLIISRIIGGRHTHDPLAALTPHEHRVLELVAQGRSNLGIARELSCRVSTVERHLSSIVGKLGLARIQRTDRNNINLRVLATLAFLHNTHPTP